MASQGPLPWQPLLAGDLRDRALSTVATLTDVLTGAHDVFLAVAPGASPAGQDPALRAVQAADQTSPRGASLAAGAAGLAVCHAMTARISGDHDAAKLAATSIGAAVDVLATAPLSTSLYSGFPGIAWAADLVDQLLAEDPPSPDDADRNQDIDDALVATVRRYPDWGPYDLVDGLVGLGCYALARWPRPAALTCLTSVIERLAGRARRDGDGVYWWTTPAQMPGPRALRYPGGGVDLGVAHGVAGVIPLLARAHRLGVETVTVRPMLDGAVRWLLAHLLQTRSGPTMPGFAAEGHDRLPTRSAWCYGDPGVAMALLLAARDADEPCWARAGTELALSAAARPAKLTGVSDAGICHGTAGLAHLFNRMYQMTGEAELGQAALNWTERTIARCADADLAVAILAGEAGLGAAAQSGEQGHPALTETGLLEGAAGVVLVLLAGCYSTEPAWDQMLLLSTAGRTVEPARESSQ